MFSNKLSSMPGKLYRGRVHSIGSGVSQGDEAPTGQLPSVQPVAGWIREPQSFPVRIQLLPGEDVPPHFDLGRSGAQANIIIFTDKAGLLDPIGRLWMRIVTTISYLR